MKWLFFQSESHSPAHVRREVFVAPSPHPEIQLWGPWHYYIQTGNKFYFNFEKIFLILRKKFSVAIKIQCSFDMSPLGNTLYK